MTGKRNIATTLPVPRLSRLWRRPRPAYPIKGEEKTQGSSPLVGERARELAEKPLTDADHAQLRNQARTWLEAEVATRTKLLRSASAH